MVLIPSVRTDVSDETLRQLVILGDAYLNLSSDEASCGPTEAIKVGVLVFDLWIFIYCHASN